VEAPEEFLRVAPEAGVRAVAISGTFIPAAASYSLGHDGVATYAVALGIAIPEGAL
jgi:predicted secreted protein